jgi:hypothetical protein
VTKPPHRDRQRIALRHPCELAPETLHQRFWANEKAPIRGMLVRSGLTVNR